MKEITDSILSAIYGAQPIPEAVQKAVDVAESYCAVLGHPLNTPMVISIAAVAAAMSINGNGLKHRDLVPEEDMGQVEDWVTPKEETGDPVPEPTHRKPGRPPKRRVESIV